MLNLDWSDLKMFLGPEANAAIGVAEGKDPKEIMGQYMLSNGMSELSALNSNPTDVSAATEQFKQAGQINPAEQINPASNLQLDQDMALNNLQGPKYEPFLPDSYTPPPISAGQEFGPTLPVKEAPVAPVAPIGEGPLPKVNQAFPNDKSLSNSANIDIGNNAVQGPQFDGYQGPPPPPANIPEPEAPGTFLGLEGKDYTKMGMQGVMAAGVTAMKPTQVQPSTAPVGPGITKGSPVQAQAPGVNSMVQPDPRLNSMQMTQTQGLISPFQQDMRRRRGY